jgi:hypothetical protein
MPIDFSSYNDDLIRAGTVATVQMHIVYGDGTDNVLTYTKDRSAEMLKVEFTVLEGEFAKRKVFANWLVKGSSDGQKSMSEHYLAMLKRIIASAFFLDPNDRSPETLAKYKKEWREFDGMRPLVEIGIEQNRDGYEDKNVIARVITRDMPAWGGRPPIDQVAHDWGAGPAPPPPAAPPQGAPQAPPPINKPPWASRPDARP